MQLVLHIFPMVKLTVFWDHCMNFPFTGEVHIQICTKISVNKFWCILNSVWTNLLNETHQEFLDTTSDLESPTAANPRKFSVKLALYICPVLVHLFFTSVGDKAVHNAVLCPDLLSDIREIHLFLLFQQLFKSANHSRMVHIWLHLNDHRILLLLHLITRNICSKLSILSRFNGWNKMTITWNHCWMNTWSLKHFFYITCISVFCQRGRQGYLFSSNLVFECSRNCFGTKCLYLFSKPNLLLAGS